MAKYPEPTRVLGLSKIYQHGKTQVPSDVRQILNVKDGDKILYYLVDGKVLMKKAE